MTDQERIDLAFALYSEVHGRLGHAHEDFLLQENFELESPDRQAIRKFWVQIAREVEEGRQSEGRETDAYAFALFQRIHEHLGDCEYTEEAFRWIEPRRQAWHMIVRVIDEWVEKTKEGVSS